MNIGGIMTVRIVTDSGADIPSEVCSDLDIVVVPLTVSFGVDLKVLLTNPKHV